MRVRQLVAYAAAGRITLTATLRRACAPAHTRRRDGVLFGVVAD